MSKEQAKAAERMLPQNIEAEAGVLGSMLIDPDVVAEMIEQLRPEDFYRHAHRLLYEAMVTLFARRQEADFITVCDLLEQRQQLEDVGGPGYITSLVNRVPSSGNARYYANIVRRTSIQRQLIAASSVIAASAFEAEEDILEVVDRAESRIFEISQRAINVGEESSLAELLSRYFLKLETLSERRGQLLGVPSGFVDLDRLTGGFKKSDLIVIAARPSIGKTSFALSIALQAALWYQQRIGIFSLEMSQEQITERFLSMHTGINLQRLSAGNIEDDEWERLVKGIDELSTIMIRVDGTSVLSPNQMRSRARRWVQDEGIDLLLIDYMQLMQPNESGRKYENRVQVIDEISRTLKLLARELNIPIVVLAQLSRAVEQRQSKIPMLSDLRESGGIEQNADLVMFIYRDEVYNPQSERRGYADIIVAKHRNGPVGTVVLQFEPQTTRFRNLPPETYVPPLSSQQDEGTFDVETESEEDGD